MEECLKLSLQDGHFVIFTSPGSFKAPCPDVVLAFASEF